MTGIILGKVCLEVPSVNTENYTMSKCWWWYNLWIPIMTLAIAGQIKPPGHTTAVHFFYYFSSDPKNCNIWIPTHEILCSVSLHFSDSWGFPNSPENHLSVIHTYVHTYPTLYLGHISYAHAAAPNRSPYVQKFHMYLLCMCILKCIRFTTVSTYISEKW